jgi:hypothetical protein
VAAPQNQESLKNNLDVYRNLQGLWIKEMVFENFPLGLLREKKLFW